MDFDQTQAIHYSFEDESEEESDRTSEKIPVSFLKVYKYKDLQEKDYPLFEGENIIGRHENCDICIPTKALSKQHSCIEIKGDNHFIHDKKSLNKTRRGKLFLTPEVRYELKTDDKILFADVECMYRIIDKTNIDSGSETGSESMLNNDTVPTTIIEDDYNDDSDASSDILQPTQCYQPTQLMKPNKAGGTLSFQVDSEEDSFIKEKSNITVKDTPAQRKKISDKSKVLLADSDSDETSTPTGATLVFTEDGRSSEEDRLLNQPTQACVMDSDVDDETDDEENKDLLNEPTQRVGGTVIPESDDEETDNSNVDMNAATQACHSLSDTDEDQQIATVTYTMDTDIKSNKKKSKQSTPIASLAPTVPYEMDADVSGVAETQSFMLDKDEELLTPIKAENSKTASSEQNNNLKNSEDKEEEKSGPIIPENLKEEILEEEPVAETAEQDLSHLFIMPTLACDMDEDVTDDPMDNIDTTEASEEGSTQQVDMEVTQVVGESDNNDETQRVDDATQLVESPKKSDATQKLTDETQEIGSEDATQLITSPKKSKQSVKSTFNDDATLMVEDNAGNYDATIAVDAAGDDTVAVDADASVAIETDSDATQPLSEIVPVIDEANAETVQVGMNDQTQLIDGTSNSEVVSNAYSAEAKQQCDEDDNSTSLAETVPVENISSVDEPTQACFTPKKKGKYKGKGKKSKGVKMAKVVLEEEDEDQDKVIEEATQAYGISPVKSTKSTPSKKYGLVVEDATQPYGQSPAKKVEITKQSISNTDEPTQYGKSPVKTSSRISRSREIGKKTPPEDKIESNDSESSNDTLPVDEIEFVPDSESPQEDKPPLIPIPSRSPHKSALASPRRKSPSPSPSPKRVAFVGVREASIEKQPEESTEEEFSPVIERILNSSPSSTSVSRSSRRTRGKKPQIDEAEKPKTNSRRKDISRAYEKSNKTRGSKKNRSQNEEEVKSEPEPRSRRGRKSEVKVDVAESQSTKVKSHEEEESLTEEMAVRSRRGKKIGSTEEVKPEEKSRSKKLGLKDEDKSEIKATIKPTRTSRKTTRIVNTEDKGDSNGQTKQVLEDQNVKPQPVNLKSQSSNQESSQESEIEQSNSGKTTRGKGKSTRKGLKSRDTGLKEEVDEIEESKAVEEPVVEPKGRQSGKSATVSSNCELSSRNVETITDTSRGKQGRKSAVAPQEAVASQTSEKKNEEVAREDLSLDESHSQPKSTRGKRASKKADTEKSVEEVPQQSKDTLTNEEEKEAAKDSMANSRSKRKSVQNTAEKDSVSDNKKKKISDNKSNQRVSETVSTSRKGRGARNVNSSQDVEPSSSVEETNSASFTRRTPKRGRGDDDTVLDNEIAASTPKLSKKGDNQLQSTPSRKRLSQDIQASPSLRRKSFGIKPKVMFTGVVDEPGEKIIKDLGGSMAETIQECTHLITDKIRRTVKLLGGISLGLQIITRQWLDDSKQAGIFLDSSKYILCDKAAEKQYKFSLRHSIETATHSSMLEGYRIHVTKSVKPPPHTMAEILECSGAQVLKSLPKKKEDKMIIISCEEDKTLCHPALTNGIDIMSSEFILTGLLRQEIDIPSFRLFSEDATKTPQKGRSRKR